MKKLIVGAAAGGLILGIGGAAGAQVECGGQYSDPCPSVVEPEELPVEVKPVTLPGATETPATAVAAKQQLPVTGTDAAGLAAIGATLVAGGGVLVWRSRSSAVEAEA